MSEEKKTETSQNDSKTESSEKTEKQGQSEDTTEQVSAEELLKQKENELLYLRAEFENFKRQSLKERSDILRYAGEVMARDLLNTLDVFEKALDQDINESNFKNFVEGISLTAEQLKSDLRKHGIEEIDCKGKPFNPNTCEALSQIPSADAKEGEVLEVMRKGFMFRDKVLRYAQVVTAAPIKPNNNNDN